MVRSRTTTTVTQALVLALATLHRYVLGGLTNHTNIIEPLKLGASRRSRALHTGKDIWIENKTYSKTSSSTKKLLITGTKVIKYHRSSQVIWKASTVLGCGSATSESDLKGWLTYVCCNYSPAGKQFTLVISVLVYVI